jgi:hypothetical protein
MILGLLMVSIPSIPEKCMPIKRISGLYFGKFSNSAASISTFYFYGFFACALAVNTYYQ